jgi:hypothetical protein
MGILLSAWEQLDPKRRGLTAAEVIHQVFKEPPVPAPDYHADLNAALEGLLGKPDSRDLGNKINCAAFDAVFFKDDTSITRAKSSVLSVGQSFRQGCLASGGKRLTRLTALTAKAVSLVSAVSLFRPRPSRFHQIER